MARVSAIVYMSNLVNSKVPVAALLVLGVSSAAGMAFLVLDETNQQENHYIIIRR